MEEKIVKILKTIGVELTLPAGRFVYMTGENADRVYLILSGRVRVLQLLPSGREFTIDVVKEGYIFGESSFGKSKIRPDCVQAVNEVRLISCKTNELIPYLEKEPKLALYLLRQCSDTMDRLASRLYEQGVLNRYGKVAAYILDVTADEKKESQGTGERLPYTHRELAESLGLNRTSVTAVLRCFEKEGWIQNGYGEICILSRDALQQFVDQQKQYK